MEDDDDTQYMLAQDPGYALYLLNLEIEHVGQMMNKEHNQSLEDYLTKLEFEEDLRNDLKYGHKEWLAEEGYMTDAEWRQEKKYFAEWDEAHSDKEDEDE